MSTTCVRICADLPRAVTGQLQNHTRWNFQPGLLGWLGRLPPVLWSQFARDVADDIQVEKCIVMCTIADIDSDMGEVFSDVLMNSKDDFVFSPEFF
ncbi:unnamed protein product [Brassica rapa subsp. trilocularis]